MKYYWDSIDLRKDLRVIKKALEKEKDPVKRAFLYSSLYDLKTSIIDEETIKSREERINSNNLVRLLFNSPKYDEIYLYFELFRKKLAPTYLDMSVSNSKIPMGNSSIKSISLSQDEMLELINEFYKTMGKEIYNIYKNLYKDRFERVRFSETLDTSYMIPVQFLNKSYVQIGSARRHICEEQLSSLAHEEGHCIGFLINPYGYIDEHRSFKEIESIFFQMLACRFFSKELNTPFFDNQLKEMLEFYYYEAEELLEYRKIADICFGQFNPDAEDLILPDENLKYALENLLYNPDNLANQIKYGFSYMVAIELFELYQEDKEEALKRLIVNLNIKILLIT